MRLIAAVEQDSYNMAVRIVPGGQSFELVGARFELDTLLTLELPKLGEATDAALVAWLEQRGAGFAELYDDVYRETVLADFLDADNALAYLALIPARFGVDAVERFANEHGLALVTELHAVLDGDPAESPPSLVARARRLALIVGATEVDTDAVLDELAGLHVLEQLIGLEHAIGRWVALASQPRAAELADLARHPPSDDVSAGISRSWYRWWWRLGRACTRTHLARIVDRVVAFADEECGPRIAADARAEAHRLAARMRAARRAELWSAPVGDVDPSTIVRDEADVHYCAFKAVSHAAHALAHVLVDTAGIPYGDASRRAMRRLADVAVRTDQ